MSYRNIGLFALSLALAAHAQAPDPARATDATKPPQATEAAEIESLKGQVESLNESFLATKATVDKLAKIKVSGYVQAQWQKADSAGIPSVAGGNFPANADQRFQVRRGRLKTTYETSTSRYVLQIDVVPTGVSLKDAYLTVMEPWLKTFSATAGVFDRPFGYEISYSSSSRESPERSRVYQAVFPGERDLGAKLEFNPTERMGFAQYFNAKGGLFTGMGPTANENDGELDFIGRAGFSAPVYDWNLSLDGGVSAYLGKVTSVNDTAFTMSDTAFVGSNGGNRLKAFDRRVYGADAQFSWVIPVVGDLLGGTTLRGEYLWGTMPATRASTAPYNVSATTAPVAVRDFSGWYVQWIQNYGNKVQSVVKYDVFDPNTAVSGADIGRAGSNLGTADVKFSTLGLGALYYWDSNVRFTAYYDLVTNESVNAASGGSLAAYRSDRKDNVFTLRAQVKF